MKPREFEVTRTTDNKQLGLSTLINSLTPGESRTFIMKDAYDLLLNDAPPLAIALLAGAC